MCVSVQIPLGLARLPVHTAIQFHDQPPLRAVKIDDVLTDRCLPTKLEALESESPQQTPRGLFSLGRRLAKVARSVNELCAACN